jgi:RNA polymerase II C-terminal domain phosphatase-like 1/2
LAFIAPVGGVPNKDKRNPPWSGNGFLKDIAGPEIDITMQEPPSGSTLNQEHDQSNNLAKLSSVMSLIREHVSSDVAHDISCIIYFKFPLHH